jgi:hypothetical protein
MTSAEELFAAQEENKRLSEDLRRSAMSHISTIGQLQNAISEIKRLQALITEWASAHEALYDPSWIAQMEPAMQRRHRLMDAELALHEQAHYEQ